MLIPPSYKLAYAFKHDQLSWAQLFWFPNLQTSETCEPCIPHLTCSTMLGLGCAMRRAATVAATPMRWRSSGSDGAIGFIGLGNMGAHMAHNLLKASSFIFTDVVAFSSSVFTHFTVSLFSLALSPLRPWHHLVPTRVHKCILCHILICPLYPPVHCIRVL